jgi:hypothetical protein
MTVAVEAGEIERSSAPSGGARAVTRLGGRFRLEERVTGRPGPGAAGDASRWKATDELLCRPVTIHLLPQVIPIPRPVVSAVQAAARVNDPRLASVYDIDYGTEAPYIVSEWTPGTHLEDLVLSGLPSPALAAAMMADAAGAIAVAHAAGLPHLQLRPQSLRWDIGSGMKITGLGIDAALAGAPAGEADAADAAADTRALARMLYALLTGFWPGEEATAIPAAPVNKGRPYSPRQVRAGVPGILDAITCHALELAPAAGPGPALTPAWLAAALGSVQRPSYPADPPGTGPGRAVNVAGVLTARHRLVPPPRRGSRHRTSAPDPVA